MSKSVLLDSNSTFSVAENVQYLLNIPCTRWRTKIHCSGALRALKHGVLLCEFLCFSWQINTLATVSIMLLRSRSVRQDLCPVHQLETLFFTQYCRFAAVAPSQPHFMSAL